MLVLAGTGVHSLLRCSRWRKMAARASELHSPGCPPKAVNPLSAEMALEACLPKSKYTLGLIFILVVNLTWSASSLLVQLLYTQSSFSSPFYLTYICTTLFCILLKPSDFTALSLATPPRELLVAAPLAPIWFLANFLYYLSLKYATITSSTVLSTLGGVFCYILELYILPESLFPPGDHDRKAGRTAKKASGVAICFICSALIGYFDSLDAAASGDDDDASSSSPAGTKPIRGDVCGLLSAVMYASYTTYIKIKGSTAPAVEGVKGYVYGEIVEDGDFAVTMEEDDETSDDSDLANLPSTIADAHPTLDSMPLSPPASSATEISTRRLLGYMGLVNVCVLTPLTVVLILAGVLPTVASLHLTWSTVGFLVFIGIVNNVISDYLWARAVIYTSATAATIGLTLTVPFGILTDFLDGSGITAMRCVGASGIVVGFVLVNL